MSNPRIYPGPRTDPISAGATFVRRHLVPGPPSTEGGQAGAGAGSICPCCNQRVALDKRSLNFHSALVLIELYYYSRDPENPYWDFYTNHARFSSGYMHMTTMLADHPDSHIQNAVKNREHGRMVMWRLIATKKMDIAAGENRDPDNTSVSSYYRISERGVNFVNNNLRIPRWYWIFQNQAWFRSNRHYGNDDRNDISPEFINIEGVLGSHFHYSEITPPGHSVETLEEVTARGRDRYTRYYRNQNR